MKVKYFIFITILSVTLQNVSFAGRVLDRSEILEIFKMLTEQPQKGWIQKGSIEAKHTEYQTSTGYMVESEEKVKYNGEQFIWQITTNSRTKYSVDEDKQQNILKENFDFNGNKERVFVWDGNSYTLYFKSGKQAIVSERPGIFPVAVNGPLTAGFIAWGFGRLSYENLIAMKSSADELEVEGRKQICMNIEGENVPKMFLTLDPSKKYALLSCSMDYNGRFVNVRTYNNYKLFADQWIPTGITVEKYDADHKLLSYDSWQLTDICPVIADSFSFSVDFDKGTLVQYHSSLIDKPLSYRSNNAINDRFFLQKKIAMELSYGDKAHRNCATAASAYILGRLNKPVEKNELIQLIQENDGKTNLYDLKNFIESKGLYCKAITGCNIQEVKKISDDCQIILYLPKQRHFVVLAGVDDEQVWLLDMSERRFFYNTKIEKLNEDMKSGVYLLVSDKPVESGSIFVEIEDEQLSKLTGGQTGYCCTKKIQEAAIGFCSEFMYGMCFSVYTIWYEVYGCEACESGNECFGEPLISTAWSLCMENMYNLGTCTIDGSWIVRYTRACYSDAY